MIATALSLAAAPILAVMALLTAVLGGDPALMLCGGSASSPLGGMAFMYGLMSLFHLVPWIGLIPRAGRTRAAGMRPSRGKALCQADRA